MDLNLIFSFRKDFIGENEKNNMSVSVRQRDAESDKQDMGEMSLGQVVNLVKRDEFE